MPIRTPSLAQPALTDALREREYSPSSCIGGNYAPHLQQYAAQSALALQSHTALRDLAYGDGTAHRLDLFLPPSASTCASCAETLPPLLVFIHGGYWQELSKASSVFAAPHCIAQGIAFAALDYTLAPAASILQMALECRQALRWLHAQAAALGFDDRRIVVAGSSAGAHLAAMTCLRGWVGDADLPAGLPAAAVLVSGVYDLQPLVGTSVNTALSLNTTTAQAVSPQDLPLDGFCPAVVCWGEVETSEFKRQSQAFANALRVLNAPTEVFEIPARNHFDVILDLARPGTALGDATMRAFNETQSL